MLPTESFYIYFYVLLAGFMSVWIFRKKTKSEKSISEFEYIGFSAFWGIVLISFWNLLVKVAHLPGNLFENPFNAGFTLSLVGMVGAYFLGEVWMILQEIHKLGWKKALRSFLKK